MKLYEFVENKLITYCKEDGLEEVSDLVSTLFLLKKDLPLSSSEQDVQQTEMTAVLTIQIITKISLN